MTILQYAMLFFNILGFMFFKFFNLHDLLLITVSLLCKVIAHKRSSLKCQFHPENKQLLDANKTVVTSENVCSKMYNNVAI